MTPHVEQKRGAFLTDSPAFLAFSPANRVDIEARWSTLAIFRKCSSGLALCIYMGFRVFILAIVSPTQQTNLPILHDGYSRIGVRRVMPSTLSKQTHSSPSLLKIEYIASSQSRGRFSFADSLEGKQILGSDSASLFHTR